ncbi:MAG: hypothetical protein R3236_07690 [Phycisphaeraceae bacterium]|nr:hypothetical protein [Phycisphaeraceae bacterium]
MSTPPTDTVTDLPTPPPPLTDADVHRWADVSAVPCVSIYLPTSPTDSEQSRIGYKNELARAVKAVTSTSATPQKEQQILLEPLRRLENQTTFWAHQGPGLVVIRTPDLFEVRRLSDSVEPRVVVGESLHLKPLIRRTQVADRFRLLCVSQDQVALHEVDRYGLAPVPLHPDVPRNMADALGGPSHVAKTKRSRYDPEDSDQRDSQIRRYFQRLDEAIGTHHPSDLPWMIAALTEHQGFYRSVTGLNGLLAETIERDPFHGLDAAELHRLARQAYEPVERRRQAEWREQIGQAHADGVAVPGIDRAAKALSFGLVDTLVVAEDHHEPGTIDRQTGRVQRGEGPDGQTTEDLLDDLAEFALHRSVRVKVLPRSHLPDGATAVALCRPGTAGSIESVFQDGDS